MSFFFFNDTATTEIYTLSLHDALPILRRADRRGRRHVPLRAGDRHGLPRAQRRGEVDHPADHLRPHGLLRGHRSEEHTSELQSRQYLVCRLLLEKKYIKPAMLSMKICY